LYVFFYYHRTPTTSLYTLSLHDALPIWPLRSVMVNETMIGSRRPVSSKYLSMAKRAALEFSESKTVSTNSTSAPPSTRPRACSRSEEHTSELQSLAYLVCRLLLEKKKNT